MNYQPFLNQIVVNKEKQQGTVISINEDQVIINYPDIRYPNDEKTYNTKIAFKNGYLSFTNDDLNTLMSSIIISGEKEIEKQKAFINKNHDVIVKRHHLIIKQNQELKKKLKILKQLFGDDFIYPPYVEFMKKYGKIIPRKNSLYLFW